MVRIAALRALAHRFSFVLLVMAAVALMVLGRVDPTSVESLRTRVTDAFSPLMAIFTQPAASIGDIADDIHDLARLRAENEALLAENAALQEYRQAAFRLEAENLSLRTLMNYRPTVPHAFLSARVIGDNSGAFVRSLAVGTVASVDGGLVRVEPIEDLGRLEYVRITDFRPGEGGGQMQLHPGYSW